MHAYCVSYIVLPIFPTLDLLYLGPVGSGYPSSFSDGEAFFKALVEKKQEWGVVTKFRVTLAVQESQIILIDCVSVLDSYLSCDHICNKLSCFPLKLELYVFDDLSSFDFIYGSILASAY